MDIQLKKGMLDILILVILKKEDSYGYKIVQDLSRIIEISESTLYPIVRRLEVAKCLSVYSKEHSGRLRKYYVITSVGKKRIFSFIEEWKEFKNLIEFIEKSMKEDY